MLIEYLPRISQRVGRARITLADGATVSAGDAIITRRNDRRLTLSATDWVTNGDRWTVTAVRPDGTLEVRHARSRRRVTLPAGYVAEHVQLGYACTAHAAQGQTVDTSHTVLTGGESRQLIYGAAGTPTASTSMSALVATTTSCMQRPFDRRLRSKS